MVRRWFALAAVLAAAAWGCSKEPPPAQARPVQPPASAPAAVEPAPTPAATGTAPAATVPAHVPAPPAELAQPKDASGHVGAKHLPIAQRLLNDGIRYLLSHQEADGGWSLGGANKPAATAMVLKCLVQHPGFDTRSEPVRRGFDLLLKHRQKDGGFYEPGGGFENYTTSLAVMALAAAQDPQLNDQMQEAVAYLKGRQILPGSKTPAGEDVVEGHPFIGGVSYGQKEQGRPDGSNAGMWAEALHEAGVPADDPAMQRVAGFFTMLQNRSESNPLPWAAVGANDGGFVYAPALRDNLATGESKAGPGPGGRGLRSYGSLTYMGFKTLLYAGLTQDDPRVAAAYEWIRRYWRLDSNPNMPQTQSNEGLYYYYHAFAKALRAWGRPVITDAANVEHNWREELIDALAERVGPDGAWVNDRDRWHEGSPILVTCYAVLSLQEAMKK